MLCNDCAEAIGAERHSPACPTCGTSVGPFEVVQERCRACRRRRLPIRGTVRAGAYTELLARLLRMYKFHGREAFEPLLAQWLVDAIESAPWRDRVEAVVAVPTHWRHRLGRTLYPAERLGRLVAQKTGLPAAGILRRVRAGPHQLGLPYSARLANVRGAFALRRGVTLREARLLVVDDVMTTGATIGECARVLRRGGAAEVYAAVVLKVDTPEPTSAPLTAF